MVELWRLTRNRYGRAVYDRLAAAGVTATLLSEYVADPAAVDPSGSESVSVEVCDPARVSELGAPVGELADGEVVLGAFEGGTPLGYLFCSLDATHDIAPLERRRSFEGAYLRRVFVAPDHRQRGVASALVVGACDWAHGRGATRASALVARDNVPSRALFAAHGFDVVRDHRYVRVGPLSHYSVRAT
ncbi:GNAT family N-acetyltransferase [Halomicroarcula sp. S1AR25-4]|uniref:GNAT family N-acetyltransferase n=1 Tax=Haloarcula sp. S1AR25-4 TaxID=2950538 RepID=UPI0028753226|nr:GNAT family N-acetyltransferase [Halomicroarcula sp. S1AR25-4]MDS0279324.1 GNAT family N-acetyltransferase [Halomicroarcula sp. S1AR25-4]